MANVMVPPPDAHGARVGGRGPLTGRELLVLQLLARGYTLPQLATLLGGKWEVVDAIAGAVWTLEATDAMVAIARARARGLIL